MPGIRLASFVSQGCERINALGIIFTQVETSDQTILEKWIGELRGQQ